MRPAALGLAGARGSFPCPDASLAAAIGSGFASGALTRGLGVAFSPSSPPENLVALGAGGADLVALGHHFALVHQHLMPITP